MLWRAFNSRGGKAQEVCNSRGGKAQEVVKLERPCSRGAESQEVLLVLLKERVSRGWSSVVTANLKRRLRPIVRLKLSLPMR